MDPEIQLQDGGTVSPREDDSTHSSLQGTGICVFYSLSLSCDSLPGLPALGICFLCRKNSAKIAIKKHTAVTWHPQAICRIKVDIVFTSLPIFGNEKT